MKNKVHILLIPIIIIFILVGCSTESSEKKSLISGVYVLSDNKTAMELVIDMSENRFTVNVLGSEFLSGKIEIDDNKLAAITDDGKFEYVFEIKDEKTLEFISGESDLLVSVGGDSSTVDMSDGLKFTLLEE